MTAAGVAPAASEVPRLIALSRGVRRIERLAAFFPDFQIHHGKPFRTSPSDRVLAWGWRPSALRAQRYAARKGMTVGHVEDGFLRSVALGRDDPPLSVVFDDIGLYLDCTRACRLEALIGDVAGWDSGKEARAVALMRAWRAGRVSKYNQARDATPGIPGDFVLVADQTRGDASIRGGAADASSFQRMLDAALAEHPDCAVVLKVHPDVLAGRKRGHFDLAHVRTLPRVTVMADDVHPAGLLEHARCVYVVTSQLGFEALMWGRPVRVFGMPFYAGWGLTQDALPAPARRGATTLERLVHAALVDYSRYVDPETGQPCEAERVLAWLALQRQMRQRFARDLCGLDFSLWKRPFVRQFFAGSRVRFESTPAQAAASARAVVAWGRRHDQALAASGATQPVIRLEDGFLRSVGLGASLVRPLSWVQDDVGVYYDATAASRLEQLLAHGEYPPALLARAAALRLALCAAKITKYNLSGVPGWQRPNVENPVLLVPGQVETDASIRYGHSGIRHNLQLLQAVRRARPDAYILYKPHPDVQAQLRRAGQDEDKARQWCDEIIGEAFLPDLLAQVDEVHVLTSLTGFEALLRDVPVHTYGQPFYAGWGLTQDMALQDAVRARRQRVLTLDQLVAGALILYPTYVSRVTRRFTTPERALQELIDWRAGGAALPAWRNVLAWLYRKP
ncbi:capsular polysaccharide biosynthesis protein [Bordetella genomosp. 13]|uniref:capsular polysaccharide biosynthesis protein n=1 Tax=Bordetella genomosp. 13 TaxID=463040 RepID=UPI0021B561CF|nr:capsular polysaccharide biosynthesis protein [Bordetella genomosp. 13]